MPALLTGEFKLLSYLGKRSPDWSSSYALSIGVYHRSDAAGRQLVWKYASTLRKKLNLCHPGLIELCRRRGYRCRQPVLTLLREMREEMREESHDERSDIAITSDPTEPRARL